MNHALEQINSRSYFKSQRSQKIKIILASPLRLEDNCFYEKWNNDSQRLQKQVEGSASSGATLILQSGCVFP